MVIPTIESRVSNIPKDKGKVKRLVGNEIELGMVIPTIESRVSNIPKDKGNSIRDYMNP